MSLTQQCWRLVAGEGLLALFHLSHKISMLRTSIWDEVLGLWCWGCGLLPPPASELGEEPQEDSLSDL